MEQKKLPSVFDYSDFRLFLGDYYNVRSSFDRSFTKSNICRMLGLPKSRSYFNDILNGKTLSSQKLELLIEILKLNKASETYFRTLVNFNQSDSDLDQKELLLDKLIILNNTPEKLIRKEVYTYYSQFHHSIIRAILDVINFTDDYVELARIMVPPVSAKTVKDSISLLKELQLIKENHAGFLKPSDQLISTGSLPVDTLIRQYQISCITMAKDLILKEKQSTLPHKVITKTMSMSETTYKHLEKRIATFNKEVNSLVHKDENPADRVYQLDLLLVPMMKRKQ